jgi:hypothetical protein
MAAPRVGRPPDLVWTNLVQLPLDPACSAAPCLDIAAVPDPTRGEHSDGIREVGSPSELVDALVGDAE